MDLKLHGARRSAVDLHTHTEQRLTVGLVQVMGPKKVRIPPKSNSLAPPKSQLVSTSGRLSHKLSPPPLPLSPSFRVPASPPHALVVIKVAAATAAAARRRDAMCLWVWGGYLVPFGERMSKVLFPVVVDAAGQSKHQC